MKSPSESFDSLEEEYYAEEYTDLIIQARDFCEANEWRKACEVQQQAVQYAENHYSDDTEAKSVLAYIYRQLSRYAEAEELDRLVLSTRQQLLGDDHEDTVASLSNLAIDLKAQGEYTEALELDEKALETILGIKGDDSRITQTCIHNLANSYFNNKEYLAAQELHQMVLNLRTKTLGPEHFETIMTMDLLGRDYTALNRFQEAVALQEKAVEAAKTYLGLSAETTIKCSVNLARTYGLLDRADVPEAGESWSSKAIHILEDVLELQRHGRGGDDADVIVAMNNLGVAYARAGRLQEAVPLITEVVNWNMKKMGPNHPQSKAAASNLGYIHKEIGMCRSLYEYQSRNSL